MSGVEIQVRASTAKARLDLSKLEQSVGSIETRVQRASSSFAKMGAAIASVLAVKGLSTSISGAADSMTTLENKVALVVGRGKDLQKTLTSLREVAKQTKSSVDASADTFNRFGRALRGSEVNIPSLIRASEAVAKAAKLSGASAETAKASIIQLGQGLGAGELRGQELMSVLEGIPRLARAIADGMGVPFGSLKKRAEDGQLTATTVFNAILKEAGKVDKEFAILNMRVSDFTIVLGDEFRRMIGNIDKVIGASNILKSNIAGITTVFTFVADGIQIWAKRAKIEFLIFKINVVGIFQKVKESIKTAFDYDLANNNFLKSTTGVAQRIITFTKKLIAAFSNFAQKVFLGSSWRGRWTPNGDDNTLDSKNFRKSVGNVLTTIGDMANKIISAFSTLRANVMPYWKSFLGIFALEKTVFVDAGSEVVLDTELGKQLKKLEKSLKRFTLRFKKAREDLGEALGFTPKATTGSADDYFVKQESELEKFQKRIDSVTTSLATFGSSIRKNFIDIFMTTSGHRGVDGGNVFADMPTILENIKTKLKEIEIPESLDKILTNLLNVSKSTIRIAFEVGETLSDVGLALAKAFVVALKDMDTAQFSFFAVGMVAAIVAQVRKVPLIIGTITIAAITGSQLFTDRVEDIATGAGKILREVMEGEGDALGALGRGIARNLQAIFKGFREGFFGEDKSSLNFDEEGFDNVSVKIDEFSIEENLKSAFATALGTIFTVSIISSGARKMLFILGKNVASLLFGATSGFRSASGTVFSDALADMADNRARRYGPGPHGAMLISDEAKRREAADKRATRAYKNLGGRLGQALMLGFAIETAGNALKDTIEIDKLDPDTGKFKKALVEVGTGGLEGALIGATIGSAFPVIGTAFGGVLGGAVGMLATALLSDETRSAIFQFGDNLYESIIEAVSKGMGKLRTFFDMVTGNQSVDNVSGAGELLAGKDTNDPVVLKDTLDGINESLTENILERKAILTRLQKEELSNPERKELKKQRADLLDKQISLGQQFKAIANEFSKFVEGDRDKVAKAIESESRIQQSQLKGLPENFAKSLAKVLDDEVNKRLELNPPVSAPTMVTAQNLNNQKASGGMIRGSGTATSDSIPHMLSNGEFVMQASAVSKFGPQWMAAVNSGIMPQNKFGGGIVDVLGRFGFGGATDSIPQWGQTWYNSQGKDAMKRFEEENGFPMRYGDLLAHWGRSSLSPDVTYDSLLPMIEKDYPMLSPMYQKPINPEQLEKDLKQITDTTGARTPTKLFEFLVAKKGFDALKHIFTSEEGIFFELREGLKAIDVEFPPLPENLSELIPFLGESVTQAGKAAGWFSDGLADSTRNLFAAAEHSFLGKGPDAPGNAFMDGIMNGLPHMKEGAFWAAAAAAIGSVALTTGQMGTGLFKSLAGGGQALWGAATMNPKMLSQGLWNAAGGAAQTAGSGIAFFKGMRGKAFKMFLAGLGGGAAMLGYGALNFGASGERSVDNQFGDWSNILDKDVAIPQWMFPRGHSVHDLRIEDHHGNLRALTPEEFRSDHSKLSGLRRNKDKEASGKRMSDFFSGAVNSFKETFPFSGGMSLDEMGVFSSKEEQRQAEMLIAETDWAMKQKANSRALGQHDSFQKKKGYTEAKYQSIFDEIFGFVNSEYQNNFGIPLGHKKLNSTGFEGFFRPFTPTQVQLRHLELPRTPLSQSSEIDGWTRPDYALTSLGIASHELGHAFDFSNYVLEEIVRFKELFGESFLPNYTNNNYKGLATDPSLENYEDINGVFPLAQSGESLWDNLARKWPLFKSDDQLGSELFANQFARKILSPLFDEREKRKTQEGLDKSQESYLAREFNRSLSAKNGLFKDENFPSKALLDTYDFLGIETRDDLINAFVAPVYNQQGKSAGDNQRQFLEMLLPHNFGIPFGDNMGMGEFQDWDIDGKLPNKDFLNPSTSDNTYRLEDLMKRLPELKHYATGGAIYGDGGPTDDKIPAMLSNGEYVIQASAAKRFGTSFLDKVNSGIMPQFFQGGTGATVVDGKFVAGSNATDEGKKQTALLNELVEVNKKFGGDNGTLNERISAAFLTALDTGQFAAALDLAKTQGELQSLQAALTETFGDNAVELIETLTGKIETATQTAIRNDAETSAQNVAATFSSSLKNAFRTGDFKSVLSNTLDSFTGNVMDTVIDNFTGSLFENSGFNRFMTGQFEESAELGQKLGDTRTTKVNKENVEEKVVSEGIFERIFGSSGEGGKGGTGIIGMLMGSSGGGGLFKGITSMLGLGEGGEGFNFGSLLGGKTPDSREAGEDMSAPFQSIFQTFTSSFGNILDKFGGGFGKIVGGLGQSLMGMFNGGGGGGFDVGSLLKMGASFFGFPMSQGGIVPNTSTSIAGKDSVPAMLTPGEMVLSTNNAKRLASNKSSGNQQVVNLNISGDISRQTKTEIYRMIPQIASGVNGFNKETGLGR